MKTSVKRGYLVNGAAVVLVYALFVALAATLGQGGSFKLILAPSIWQCCYLILLAASLNLVLGFMGQLSLGHCGFMAIGAYTAALMSLAFQRAGVYDEKSGAVFIGILFCFIILRLELVIVHFFQIQVRSAVPNRMRLFLVF